MSLTVTSEIESIDRMYCNVYQPRLQYLRGAAAFFSLLDVDAPMTKMCVTAIHDFVELHELDLVHFTNGQRKGRHHLFLPRRSRRDRGVRCMRGGRRRRPA